MALKHLATIRKRVPLTDLVNHYEIRRAGDKKEKHHFFFHFFFFVKDENKCKYFPLLQDNNTLFFSSPHHVYRPWTHATTASPPSGKQCGYCTVPNNRRRHSVRSPTAQTKIQFQLQRFTRSINSSTPKAQYITSLIYHDRALSHIQAWKHDFLF